MRSLQRLHWPFAGPTRRRAGAWLGLCLMVLLAHVALLRAVAPPTEPQPAAMQTRPTPTMLVLTRPAPSAVPDAIAPAAPTVVAGHGGGSAPPAAPVVPPPARPAAMRTRSEGPLAVGPAATQTARDPAESSLLPVPAATSHSEHVAAESEASVPVYATQLPDPAQLHYQLQRGALAGSASLHWQRHDDGSYALHLETQLQGQQPLGSASRGAIDADGVAPLRHTDLRRAREVRAANFQRDTGRITFSGPQLAYPLVAGAQDRLSWMIQLPAIVRADPELGKAGASVTLFVVGTRGDAEPWRFEVLSREVVELPAGAVQDAVRLMREPSRPYDTRVEVWLDPARQHLPVRVQLTTVPGGPSLELSLLRVGDRPM